MTRYYHTMPIDVENYQSRGQNRRYVGGKIGFNKAISKVNPVNHVFKNKKLVNAMGDIGQFTQKKILPTAVSIGIPLASTALGAVATAYGGPMAGQMASSLSQNLMEQYIPDKYQSKNKYVGMFGDALSMGLGGDVDPMQAQALSSKFLGNVQGDVGKLMTPKNKRIDYNSMDYTNNMQTRPNINLPLPPRAPQYNPDNIYQDLMEMMQRQNYNDNFNNQIDTHTNLPPKDYRGSLSGLLGAGVKNKYNDVIKVEIVKKRKPKKSNKKKNSEKISKVELYETPRHKKFSHAKNLALDQLLEANEHRKKSDNMKKAEEMIERQTRMLKAMGY